MKRLIRSKVFETNSSSVHTLSFQNGEMQPYNSIPVCTEDNTVHITFEEFGWDLNSFTDPYTKLQYLLTMVLETECRHIESIEEYYETEGFKKINEVIKRVCHCNGIEIYNHGIGVNKSGYTVHYGYIDHQSCEDYSCLQDYLDEYDIDIERYIFDSSVVLITDNDNH